MLNLVLIIYLVGMISFVMNRYHMMMLLMSIEFMYLSLMVMMFFNSIYLNVLNIFLFLVTIVCEASLGLSLLVVMSFFYGNEKINSLNLIKC
uniref:NADH-ubiquinone oxidoreductase chain 4L n=1 Tax=Archaeocroton sphenodonti TaxID=2599316 RepID=H9M783_9ACAR|nr:NADH dehydrogenase subunit 4L [Archaeocroton sphenodonti]AET63100.1 NADH dehydrogenase subunit 4L [Archaeocroton sphenodonti]